MTTKKVGKCKWTLISPGFKLPLPCPCDQGIFKLEEGPLPRDTDCENCGHTIADHGESSPGFWRPYVNDMLKKFAKKRKMP